VVLSPTHPVGVLDG